MDVNTAVAEIQDGRPANILYPSELRDRVLCAVPAWKNFCQLPTKRKREFIYVDDQMYDGSGYELKEKKGSTLDLKENFHITLRDVDRLASDAFSGGIHGGSEFIWEADGLINATAFGIGDFLDHLEGALSLRGLKQGVMDAKDRWVFRYLHYFGGCGIGDQIAASHSDRSGITLHLFESGPGLEYLDFGKQWRPMPVQDGCTAIIPGMQLQFASENKVKALCHRVLATEESYVSGRYSVVCFIPIPNTKIVNKNAVGRLQDFPAGFNYDMAFTEFQTLFV